MPRKKGIPKLRRHKARNIGVVTLDGHDHYFRGLHWPPEQEEPPAEIQAAYDRLIAEWLAGGRQIPATSSRETEEKKTTEQPGTTTSPNGQAGAASTTSTPLSTIQVVPGLLVEDLLARFWDHATQYYRHPDGTNTNELTEYRCSLRPLRHLYANHPIGRFTPQHLKAVRELMLKGYEHPEYGPQTALARGVINNRVRRIVRMFKWGVSEMLVPAEVWHALQTLPTLKKGRSQARETEPVHPVAEATVDATVKHLQPWLVVAVRTQQYTGARAGEVLRMRDIDLDRSEAVWLYRVPQHKGSWRGHERVIPIGPRAQEVLSTLLKVRCPLCGVMDRANRIGWRPAAGLCGPCSDRMDEQGIQGPWPVSRLTAQEMDYVVFSPRDAMEDRARALRAKRKSKVQPSQQNRAKKDRKRAPGERYGVRAYNHAIERACKKAGVEHWSSHQLRHLAGTLARQRFGLEGAQHLLGHHNAQVTQIYAERDLGQAIRLASEIG